MSLQKIALKIGGIGIKELFLSGARYADYVAKMGEEHQAGFAKSYERAEIPEEAREALRSLAYPVYALAVSEPTCGDCRLNLPILAKMADASFGKLTLSCLSRDAHPGLLAAYPASDGSQRIPTFIFLAADWSLKGYYVERPPEVTQVLTLGTAEEKRIMRIEYNAGHYAQSVIRGLLEIIA